MRRLIRRPGSRIALGLSIAALAIGAGFAIPAHSHAQTVPANAKHVCITTREEGRVCWIITPGNEPPRQLLNRLHPDPDLPTP